MGIAWYTVHIQYSPFLLGLQDCIAGMKDKKKIYDKKIKPPCGGIAPDGSDGGDEAEVLHNHRMQHHFFTTKPKRTCRRDIAFSVIPAVSKLRDTVPKKNFLYRKHLNSHSISVIISIKYNVTLQSIGK